MLATNAFIPVGIDEEEYEFGTDAVVEFIDWYDTPELACGAINGAPIHGGIEPFMFG